MINKKINKEMVQNKMIERIVKIIKILLIKTRIIIKILKIQKRIQIHLILIIKKKIPNIKMEY